MESLATGTIMSDTKEYDLMDYLFIPTSNKNSNVKTIKKYLQNKLYLDTDLSLKLAHRSG